ncbi:DUF2868 domain-containing protein [Salinispirillum sp. LH 10-3-1]|uniref:DUF2868 domain-containing protein n=1 Tax=Salinispirillum sp. LH 10-3-1 TaxID=2952525 RepID=A0AB38YCT9_9GAMM
MVFGVLLAIAGLSYSPDGRINIMLVWLLWAALPLLGVVLSVLLMARSGSVPWIVRLLPVSTYWRPTDEQRWYLLWVLHALWALAALGLVATFLLLLVFTDLAFGWSSTVINSADGVVQWVAVVSWPWRGFWESAVPTAEVLSATRFVRIDQAASGISEAAAWWPFLLANVVFYNLLPRVALSACCWVRWRWYSRQAVKVSSMGGSLGTDASANAAITEGTLADWSAAEAIYWEHPVPVSFPSSHQMGLASWQHDQQVWDALKASRPAAILWHVSAGRSPVAELGDLIVEAGREWQPAQALLAHQDSNTVPDRHIASWRAFARQHRLVWISL